MLCDELEGYDGGRGGREGKEGEDTCPYISDLLPCTAEHYRAIISSVQSLSRVQLFMTP